MASTLPADKPQRLSKLALIWQFAKRYPGQICAALVALIVAAGSTLAIPRGLKRVVDNGFAAGSDHIQ